MRFAAVLFVLALGLPAVALAVTPEELARLRAAGLGDQVLLALVDTTGVQGRVGADEAMDLARAGVSDRVIAAAIRRAAADEARALLPPEPVVEQTPLEAIPPLLSRLSSPSSCPCPSCHGWRCRWSRGGRTVQRSRRSVTTRDLAGSSTRISVR